MTKQEGSFDVVNLNGTLRVIGVNARFLPAPGYVLVSQEQLEELQLAVKELHSMLCCLAGMAPQEEEYRSICAAIAAITTQESRFGRLADFMKQTLERHISTTQADRREREREANERAARIARGEDDGVPF